MATPAGNGLADCLIGLPEAFNVRGGYWSPQRLLDPFVSVSLRELSIKFGVAFVAGLLEPADAMSLPFSSAYLIDGDVTALLSRKMENDRSDNYQPCTVNCDQVYVHRGVCIAALLCMDAVFNKHAVAARHQMLLDQFRAVHSKQKVLFVPAHMMTYSSPDVAKSWPSDIITVLANSAPSQSSVIRCGEELICTKPQEYAESTVYLSTIN